MSNNKIKYFVLLIITIFSFQFALIAQAQSRNNYSMPFASNESWKTNDYQGVHTSALGFAIDLFPPDNSSNEVLALGSGSLSRVCTADNVTVLRLLTDNNDNFRFAYIDANSVPVKDNQELIVKKGDKIGQLAKPGIYKNEKCDLTFPVQHLMLSWEKSKCNLEIQQYKFTCDNMKKCNDYSYCNFTSINQSYTSNLTVNTNNMNCDLLLKSKYSIGETGEKISKLQQCLKDIGLFNYLNGITGYYGNYTLGQLQKFNSVTPSKKELTDCEKVLIDYYIQGDSGEKISQFQECLKQKNYFNYPAGITGYYGEYTKTAYNNFLNSYGDICSLLKQASYNQGEISPRVKRLQQCMRDAKVFDFPINTGYFGIITQASLKVWKSS
jgi:peptidoglycan hydrolase-like protein with peptidoglycan-binding domain